MVSHVSALFSSQMHTSVHASLLTWVAVRVLNMTRRADTEGARGRGRAADQPDVTFEELMKQYREYERQQGIISDGEDDGEGDEDGDGDDNYEDVRPNKHAHGSGSGMGDKDTPKETPGISRSEVLQSRAGRDAWKRGTQGRMPTADVDRRTDLREPKTPGGPPSLWSKRAGDDVEGSSRQHSRQQSREQSRQQHSRQGTAMSGRPSTRASSIADRGRLDEEMMGDAIFFGMALLLLFQRVAGASLTCLSQQD
jgi:hypothetical protein